MSQSNGKRKISGMEDPSTPEGHQQFVATGYFDEVQNTITSGKASPIALAGSTERAQFHCKHTRHAAPVKQPAGEARN